MPDPTTKRISELTTATQINNSDMFVLEQSGEAKKLLGSKLIEFINRNVVSVTVTQLPAGSTPTASFNTLTGALSLGIPKGDTGDPGTIATPLVAGITKVYTSTGQNTDGSMTQKAITDAIFGVIEEEY